MFLPLHTLIVSVRHTVHDWLPLGVAVERSIGKFESYLGEETLHQGEYSQNTHP